MTYGYFLPNRERELLTWSSNFEARINADPALYGLTAMQASEYSALHYAYADAMKTTTDPSTRTPSSIVTKRDAKKALKADARRLAKIIQAHPGTTDPMRRKLGLTIADTEPTKVPAPAQPPGLMIEDTSGRTVRLRLRDASRPTRRGRPDGVIGATIFSYVGETPPADIHDWRFAGHTTRTRYAVHFPPTVPAGTKVWLTACWLSPRLQSGPAATAVSAHMQFGITTIGGAGANTSAQTETDTSATSSMSTSTSTLRHAA